MLAARLTFAISLKMLALRALIVVAVCFQVGFADPQLAPRVRCGFGGCLLLAEGRIFEPYACRGARSRFSPGRAVVAASLSLFHLSAMGLRVTDRVSIQLPSGVPTTNVLEDLL